MVVNKYGERLYRGLVDTETAHLHKVRPPGSVLRAGSGGGSCCTERGCSAKGGGHEGRHDCSWLPASAATAG